ncbi:MAG TPA: rhomboid family intramembrane serine protease, partial [Chthoniobacterales bacterium]
MSVLNTLEKRFGRFAIPGLIRYVVALNALVFLLNLVSPSYVYVLSLDPDAIAAGQVWRLVTWIFIPTTMSLLWIIFYLMFTWWMGDLLESTWGTFRLNLYYLVGYLGGTAAAMLFGASLGNIALNASLLFAIGTLAPNLEILLFGILPLRLKWVALI